MDTDNALVVLVAYLRAVRLTQAHAPEDDGFGFVDREGHYTRERSPAAETAREWARELLKAADADGMSGCKLCGS